MVELVDMPGMSQICRICRLGTFNLKRVGGGFRGPFCVPTEGVLKIPFGGQFCMGGDPLRGKKYPVRVQAQYMPTRSLHSFGFPRTDPVQGRVAPSNYTLHRVLHTCLFTQKKREKRSFGCTHLCSLRLLGLPFVETLCRVVHRVLLLDNKGASPLKEDLLPSKALSNYWYVGTYAYLTQNRQYHSTSSMSQPRCLFLILHVTYSYV